jgi:hydrogenase nickel incorporation protein HypB
MKIKVIKNILTHNDNQAEKNRDFLNQKNILTINMMSSPGAGKTSIIETTIKKLQDKYRIAVIEGDLMTSRDAERIHQYGVPVVQINTEGGCHLNADMVWAALKEIELTNVDLLIIENVGNLVCPSSFDLGESFRVVVSSIPEGDDKPIKYPLMFADARVCLLNKVDLLAYTNFDIEHFTRDVYNINPKIQLFEISTVNGLNINKWCQWLEGEIKWKKGLQER